MPGHTASVEVFQELVRNDLRPTSQPAVKPTPVHTSQSNFKQARSSSRDPIQAGAVIPARAIATTNTLEELKNLTLGCGGCKLVHGRNQVVFGEGNPHAKLMFIGEGPGYHEDLQGRPFVGPAGELLNKMIRAMGFTREEVYIANIVKCRPPNNRNPEPDEANACLGFLIRQIELIQPKVIVLLGAVALRFLTNRKEGILHMRGKWIDFHQIPVMPTFHPSYLLRQPSAKKDAWIDLQKVMQVFGKVYPKST